MDTFNDLVFAPNPNRTGWNIATKTWINNYGIIVNEEDSSRLPDFPDNKYQVSVTFDNNLIDGVVIPTKLEFLCTPNEITQVMEQLQNL
jgi:hypothetical protein